MKKILVSFALFFTACASYEVTPTGHTMKTTTDYMGVITKHSDSVRRYSGFYNILDMESTIITSQVAQAQLEQSAMLYQWDEARFAEEKAKFETRLNRESEIFLSFYTPDRKNDDLFKKNTIWKIFLDVEGKRYEGRATKLKLQLVEIEGLYPYHNRFYTPYSIIFPVPMRSIEDKPIKLTVTGAVGAGVMEFKP
ncbi:hypothetical protein AZI86_02795 [Bdellovibrio bacteriovorus]|uniref:Lipoprotein n=1 Tax=Bdellovibrio bacteriovorus TaxID=959 RepID=A0A150WNW0_BDEBC|nr:hypothetical protein [Bdellovibrio bacteriovorus]KYG66014.1 hypothetical protein AZI86_02795 [Bdellovibrio bacteriovorus]